jgi:glycogen operon protein
MINAYWENLQFQIQEGTASEWRRIVDTALPTPNDFSNTGELLETLSYPVAPRSVVVLLRLSGGRVR